MYDDFGQNAAGTAFDDGIKNHKVQHDKCPYFHGDYVAEYIVLQYLTSVTQFTVTVLLL